MTRFEALAHVTLNTGHVRRSPRSEVGADVLRALRGEVLPALEPGAGQPWAALAAPLAGAGR